MWKRIFLLAMLFFTLPSLCFAQVVSVTGDDSITAVMSGAAATTNPTYNTVWAGTGGGKSSEVGSLNGTSSVGIVAAPASGNTKEVMSISIYNADTEAVTVTVRKTVGATNNILLKQSIPVGSTLIWSERTGIQLAAPTAVANVGVVAGSGVSVSEQGNGVVQKSVFTLDGAVITMRDTEQGGGLKIYDFPEGRIQILGVTATMRMATTSAIATTLNSGVTCNWGVGTATQANATLTTTEQDLIPVTTWTSGTTINVLNTAAPAALAATAQFNGTTTPIDAYVNLAVAGATDIDANATVACTGVVTIVWTFLGDY